ncbi:MAG: long-chain-fatty-acid--CoA ligase [Deltaproteobacteria bacterium]|nr:long-chain-fatty-acid--CoA ligase [Deltaproteobacteria bacterium]MBW1923720.1 long-chain-fatty-acid--CoA ligase [Deltaproteobacteria bacterium]MBW1950532.1 long-chain-fatty-acid--CoA ligase [Deltaproteobacteria bacterium]MBW2008485.1 long-chain-fatty-acid--CoA ligase [Deltaproteobacteria bacterium]MBW2347726.1 long-chain-fatty-acid--CoA ligase [Deltaproteobacteria bacterium]
MKLQVTLPYMLQKAVRNHPLREAIVSEKGRWTYGDWRMNARKRAAVLRAHGIGKGDHVAVIFLNGHEILETFMALMMLGAVIVPLNVRLSSGELRYILDHSDATNLVLSHEFEAVIREIKGDLPRVRRYFKSGGEPAADMLDFEAETSAAEPLAEEADLSEEDPACILYTAGTTGRPKGVVLSHGNCAWAAVNIAVNIDLKPDYRVLLVFPLYHAAAFLIVISNLFVGCTTVSMRAFDPKRVMELVAEEKISRMTFPPTVWNFILQLPDLESYDTSSVRSLSSGAEAMPLETKKRLLKLFPNAKLGETYGMTESAATITTLDPDQVLRKMASVGKAFVTTQVRLVDDEDRDIPPGRVGEVISRGPNVMVGYYKDPEATAETLRGGWLHTGDLGRVDEEGFLYIVDRKKDMIITGGENIFPREIEEVLYAHPKILEAAVIGLPDPQWGERVHAVVVLKEGQQMTEEEVIDYCKANLASFKKPKSVEFVDLLPRSAAGKVLKRVLRDERT